MGDNVRNLLIRSQDSLRLLAAIVLSLGFTLGFYWWWPCKTVFDDGGIVLKYMDNFAKGLFYHYNVEDGPVFGVSGFVHGVLSGGVAWSGLLTAEHAVAASNIIGLVLLNITIMLILLHFNKRMLVVMPVWLLVVFSSHRLLVCTFQGLETPLHIGIVLGAYLAFLKTSRRCLWVLSALAIISKLDAVPVVGLLLLMDEVRSFHYGGLRNVPGDVRRLLFWFLLPLGVWIVFSIAVFGSPMPHTAQAKMSHHRDMSGLLCPFLSEWFSGDGVRLTCVGMASALFAVCHAYLRRPIIQLFELLSCALGAIGLMALYFVYNPVERMPWYYALPELLVFLQGGVLIAVGLNYVRMRREEWVSRMCVCGVFLMAGLAAFNARPDLWYTISYINAVETERIAAGEWIKANSRPGDRLITGSGHIARSSGLYCYDQSGLNSDIVLKQWGQGLLKTLHPEWRANHGLLSVADQRALGYELAHSAYNIATERQFDAFRVFRRIPPGAPTIRIAYPVAWENILTDESKVQKMYGNSIIVKGKKIWLNDLKRLGGNGGKVELLLGARKTVVPIRVSITFYDVARTVLKREDVEIESRNRKDYVRGYSKEIRCSLAFGGGVDYVTMEVHDPLSEGVTLEIVDPTIVVTEERDVSR